MVENDVGIAGMACSEYHDFEFLRNPLQEPFGMWTDIYTCFGHLSIG
jgi:hypothetical protein